MSDPTQSKDRENGQPSELSPDTPLTDLVERVIDTADEDEVTLRRVLEATGTASFVPALMLPALAVATPLSGIPLFSSAMGVVICLVSLQLLFRRKHLWLPDWVLRRHAPGDKLRSGFEWALPTMRWLDRHTHRRMPWLTRRPLIFVPQLLCVISGALMPFLEFVPFSSSVLGASIAIIATGLLTRDGAVIVLGCVPYALIGYLVSTTQ